LALSQKEALGQALASKVLVITGGPGVGKTTLVNAVLKVLEPRHVAVALAAPTGRATKRTSEATGAPGEDRPPPARGRFADGRFQAWGGPATGMRPAGPGRGQHGGRAVDGGHAEGRPGERGRHPRRRCRPAPVRWPRLGAGRHHRLRRRAGGPANGGLPPGCGKPDRRQCAPDQRRPDAAAPQRWRGQRLLLVEAGEPEDAVHKVVETVQNRIPRLFGFDQIRDVQVLCPMNRGALGARALNLALQAALNPASGQPSVERFGQTARRSRPR
jgi:exodeoxyribonuclease V alpha subunit